MCADPAVLRDCTDGVQVSAGQLRQGGAAGGARELSGPGGAGRRAPRGGNAKLGSVRSGLTFFSFFSQFTTTVVSCSPAELQIEGSNGKKEVLSGFQVVLEDTLLFPEGGGQVADPTLPLLFPPLASLEASNSFLLSRKMICFCVPDTMNTNGS